MKVESGQNMNLTTPNSGDYAKSKTQTSATKQASDVQPVSKQKVTLDNSGGNLQKLQLIATKFGINKKQSADKPGLTLEQRASRRERLKQAQKQQNLEHILEHATEYIDNSNAKSDVDPDWLYQFFEAAETIHSKPMQALWGKILAMQTARPDRFSLRAIETLKKMTYQEACTFQTACSLLLKDKSGTGGRIFTGLYRQKGIMEWFQPHKVKGLNLSKFGLNYPDLLSLIDLGLIYSSEIESSPFPKGHVLSLETMQSKLFLNVKQENTVLTYYKLTQAGRELATLIATSAKDEYFKQLAETFIPELEVVSG